MRSALLILVTTALCASCAAPARTAKGGLVPFATADAAKGGAKRVALVVGISEFDDQAWKGLKWAAKDAVDFAGALEGFTTVKVLTTRVDTTRAAVLAALQDLRKDASSPDDTVVIYFSSHGTLDRAAGGPMSRYVVTSDARKRIVGKTAISVGELFKAVAEIPSRRKAVVFAMCHSGKGKSALTDELEEALSQIKSGFFVRPIEDVSEATVILSASAWGETAAEDDKLKNDIYTFYLVEGLRGAGDLNGDGAVTVTEAHEYARDKTYYFTGGRQKPSLELHMDGADPVVLRGSRQRAGRPMAFSYAPSAQGLALYMDGRKKGDLPGSVCLDEGEHMVALVNEAAGREVYSGKVAFSQGEVIDVSRLIPPGVGFEGGAGAGLMTFSGDYFSRRVMPTSPTVAAEFTLRNVLVRRLELKLMFEYLHASGTMAVYSEPLSYTTDAGQLRLGAGTSYKLHDFRVSGHLAGGVLYIQRNSSNEALAFRKKEDAWGLTASMPLAVSWNFWGPMNLAVTGGPGLLFTEVAGAARTEPFFAGALVISAGRW